MDSQSFPTYVIDSAKFKRQALYVLKYGCCPEIGLCTDCFAFLQCGHESIETQRHTIKVIAKNYLRMLQLKEIVQ